MQGSFVHLRTARIIALCSTIIATRRVGFLFAVVICEEVVDPASVDAG
jgi:hypothetical protein